MPNIKPHHLMQGLVTLLLVGLVIVLESISAAGAYETEADHLRGVQMAALTLICAAIAFIGFGLAGRLKDDERPRVRRRAKAARFVALAFLFLGPIPFLGSALKMERLERDYAAYAVSPAYEADRAVAAQAQLTISDRTAQEFEIREAARRTIRPTSANLSLLDAEFWMALLLQGLMIFASDALRVPAPITADERLALMYKARGAKAAATRRKNKAAKQPKKGLVALAGGKK